MSEERVGRERMCYCVVSLAGFCILLLISVVLMAWAGWLFVASVAGGAAPWPALRCVVVVLAIQAALEIWKRVHNRYLSDVQRLS